MKTDAVPVPTILLGRLNDAHKLVETTPSDVKVSGVGPVVTFAPLGSDRANGAIIPNLVEGYCSSIVVDPDGIYYQTTAEILRKKGHRIIQVDPFRLVSETTEAIDPFELINNDGQDPSIAIKAVANLLFPASSCSNLADTRAADLLGAVIGYCAAV